MARDLYDVLGVPKTASEEDIKKAFRKLARKHHPDRHSGGGATQKSNEDRFKEVNQANEVLSDPKRRTLYDEFGEASMQQGFDADRARAMRDFGGRVPRGGAPGGPGGVRMEDLFGQQGGGDVDMSDLFGGIFGGQGRGRPRPQGPRRGADMESTITIDFASSLKGTTLSLRFDGSVEPIQVRVPAGASEGGRLRIPGKGGPGAMGGPPGDLLLTVHVTPHPHFKREGDDLSLDLPITIVEAWEGAKVRVPTVDGEVVLKVPAKTQSGDVTRLRGKGVQRPGRGAGDLYVKFMLRLPAGDDPSIARAMEELRPHCADPRDAIKL